MYKRQLYGRCKPRWLHHKDRCNPNIPNPVSYTHLDVYKRQGSGYYGGGGGSGSTTGTVGGGGGGGSSYTGGLTGATNSAGSGSTPANASDSFRNGAGNGGSGGTSSGSGSPGASGIAIITYGSGSSTATQSVNWAQINTTTGTIDSANPGAGACSGWCTTAAYNLPQALSLIHI